MNETIKTLETKLNDVFAKKAPALPGSLKRFVVDIAAIASLVVGILSLLSALSLWRWAHDTQHLSDYVQQICRSYGRDGCAGLEGSRFSIWLWLALAVVLIEGVLYLLAYPGLRDRKKQGWNYLFYGALVNVAYAVVSLFTSYDRFGHFIGALIGSAFGFYILFQIRSRYDGEHASKSSTTSDDENGAPSS